MAGKRQFENNELVLKNTESLTIELFLLAYPLLLISGDILIPPHYLLIISGIGSGICLAFLFQRISYSVQSGLLLSFFVTMPLFFIGVSVAATSLAAAYVFWRMHTNFSAERHARWNFIAINTIVFTVAYLFTSIYLYQPEKTGVLHGHVQLFVITTVLSIVFRYLVVITTRRRTANFQFKEVNKVFSQVLGIGAVSFLVVYYFMESAFTAMVGLISFIFGDLFKRTASSLPEINFQGPSNLNKSEKIEKIQPPASSESIDLSLFITISIVIIVIIFVAVFVANRKISTGKIGNPNYRLKLSGIRKQQQSAKNDELNHLRTSSTVRLAYQDFEKDAFLAKSSRLAGETVKEWFDRMGWERDNQLIMTYDKARYGSLTISEEESRQFVETLNKIKINNFNKNV